MTEYSLQFVMRKLGVLVLVYYTAVFYYFESKTVFVRIFVYNRIFHILGIYLRIYLRRATRKSHIFVRAIVKFILLNARCMYDMRTIYHLFYIAWICDSFSWLSCAKKFLRHLLQTLNKNRYENTNFVATCNQIRRIIIGSRWQFYCSGE